jgi:predicted kinase
MSGLSGAGKSTTAKYLARKLNAVHLRSDAVRKHLAGIPLLERGGDEIYTPEMTQKTYSRLLALGIILANQGWSVILDAKYDRQDLREEAISQATEHQLPVHIINCTAPVEVLTQRLLNRTDDIADATADLLTSQINQSQPFTDQEQSYLTVVDTTLPLEAQLSGLI